MLEKLLEVLTRIAVAVEKIEARYAGAVPAVVPVAASKETKAKKETSASQVMAVAEKEVNPFEPENTDDEKVTFESLTDLLKTHAKKLGTKVTVALIIKHGADRTTPKMNTIPEANFKACFDEATADLKKVEGSKTK